MGIRNREHKSYDPKTDAGDYIAKFTELNIALVICAVGMYMTVQSNIGLAPWMALSVGFQNITGINYGIWTNIIGVFVIAADIIMISFEQSIPFSVSDRKRPSELIYPSAIYPPIFPII